MLDLQAPPDDDPFELLANHRRRHILRCLADSGGEAPLWELSRNVAAHETDTASEEVDEREIRRVYVSLYQTHVPTLQESGFVEYDETERQVRLGDRTDEIIALLQDWSARRRRWAVYYLVAAFGLAGFVVLYVVRIGPLSKSVVSASVLGAAVALPALVVAHYYGVRYAPFGEHPFEEPTSK